MTRRDTERLEIFLSGSSARLLGREVATSKLHYIEVKSGRTASQDFSSGLRRLSEMRIQPGRTTEATLV